MFSYTTVRVRVAKPAAEVEEAGMNFQMMAAIPGTIPVRAVSPETISVPWLHRLWAF
jgi:hypothetical protein